MWRLAVMPPRFRSSGGEDGRAEAARLRSMPMATLTLKNVKKIYPHSNEEKKKKKPKKGEAPVEEKKSEPAPAAAPAASVAETEEIEVEVEQIEVEVTEEDNKEEA